MQQVVATLCYLLRDGKVLMIRGQKPQAPHFQRWNGVGGKLDPEDQDDLIRCVTREIEEETGYTPVELVLSGAIRFTGMFDGQEWLVYIYTCAVFTGELRQSAQEGPLRWFDREDLSTVPMVSGDDIFVEWVLSGRRFLAHFTYRGNEYVDHQVVFPLEKEPEEP